MANTTQVVTYMQQPPQQVVPRQMQPRSPPKIYQLPERMKKGSFYLGIIMLVYGITSLAWGCIGYALVDYRFFILSTGINIVSGVFFVMAGTFGILTYKITINPHLMHTYYAFTLLSFAAAIFQLTFSCISYAYIHYFSNSLRYVIVSTVLSACALPLSLAGVIILSHQIYCNGDCCLTSESTVHPAQQQNVQVMNPAGYHQPVMMTPINMPVSGVVYYNTGVAPGVGIPGIQTISQQQILQQQIAPQQPQPPPQQPPQPPPQQPPQQQPQGQSLPGEPPKHKLQPLPDIRK